MQCIEAPNIILWEHRICLFLAGGITGCPDWQGEAVKKLQDLHITILNPRRKNFPIHDKSAAEEQIMWEFNALNNATHILFWFCKATLCPIVLYELGRHLARSKAGIFIGIEPGYKRAQDVMIQTRLANSSLVINNSFDDLMTNVGSVHYEKTNFSQTHGFGYPESGTVSER
jgi:hypothetical protein